MQGLACLVKCESCLNKFVSEAKSGAVVAMDGRGRVLLRFALLGLIHGVVSIDNGLGITPPRGEPLSDDFSDTPITQS
jgi:hypothetical protein